MKNIDSIVAEYKKLFPDEVERLAKLDELIASGSNPFSRKNYLGHITAGCLIFNQQNRVLMIHHNIYKRYFAPAGHVDPEDQSIAEGALREVAEEVGIKANQVFQWSDNINTPVYIDTHYIGPNAKKGEDEHYHTEFEYILKVESDDVIIAEDEVSSFKWFEVEEYISTHPDEFQSKALQKIVDLGLLKP